MTLPSMLGSNLSAIEVTRTLPHAEEASVKKNGNMMVDFALEGERKRGLPP